MSNKMSVKNSIQNFGKFLSGMVMPNIGAFIAWGFITCFFIKDGWFPNPDLETLVSPTLKYLLPLLIGYTGGSIGGKRGSVVGAIATMGVIIGSDIPMLIGGMIMGPLGGILVKYFDKFVDGKIPSGFEMLINNFSVGIIGMIVAILGFYAIGPAIEICTSFIEQGVSFIIEKGFIPIISIFIEPAKVLFLNNAVNHGILTPIGISQTEQLGKSIMFLLESNPGPGLGVLLAYALFGKGSSKQSAPGSIVIHFLGGIHEIYFPYILMKPLLILATIAGGACGVLVFSILGAGLVASPSPGSIFAILALAPKNGMLPILLGIIVSTLVAFAVSIPIIKVSKEEDNFEESKENVKNIKYGLKQEFKDTNIINNIIFACDAGMGSSAMGASRFKMRVKDLELNISILNTSVDNIPKDAQVVVTHKNLVDRVLKRNKDVEIIPISNFLKDPMLDELYERLKNQVKTN